MVEETGEIVYNGLIEIYVNCVGKTGDKISRLMDCFNQPMVEAIEFLELTRRYQEIKSKGEISMCDKVEQFAKEYAKEYVKEYVEVQQIKTILNLDKAGVSIDIIASSTNKSVEEIETILNLPKNGIGADKILHSILKE